MREATSLSRSEFHSLAASMNIDVAKSPVTSPRSAAGSSRGRSSVDHDEVLLAEVASVRSPTNRKFVRGATTAEVPSVEMTALESTGDPRKFRRMVSVAPRMVKDDKSKSKVPLLPDMDVPEKWEDAVCGMEVRRFKKVAAVFAALLICACILGAFIFSADSEVPVGDIGASPPFNVTARLQTSILIEGYAPDDFGGEKNPERFRWAMSKYLKFPPEAVTVLAYAARDWSLFAEQSAWDAQMNQTLLSEQRAAWEKQNRADVATGPTGRRLLAQRSTVGPHGEKEVGLGGGSGSRGAPRRHLTQSVYPFTNVTYEVVTGNATETDRVFAAVMDLVYSVEGAGNIRLVAELYAMGMKKVLTVLGSRKPVAFSWPPPPSPPPPPLPPPSPPNPPPPPHPPPNATA